jgi:hypothetical protein
MQTKCKRQILAVPRFSRTFAAKTGMMRKALLLLILCLFVLACENTTKEKRVFCLQGVWILRQVKYPDGMEHHYSMEGSGTYCLLYERDSILYECSLTKIPSGYIIMPTTKNQVTLIEKGNG